jgi:cytoskeletal protein CcmA (bactofilin family)
MAQSSSSRKVSSRFSSSYRNTCKGKFMLKTTNPLGRSDGANTPRGLFGRTSPSTLAPALTPAVVPVPAAVSSVAAKEAPAAIFPPAAEQKPEGATGNRLLVGPDVKLKGAEILDCDTLVVEGRVEATMDSHIIRIAEQGTFCGKVSIDTAAIHGCFDGELTARSQLIIHATGRVKGKMRYGKILIEEGGQICGDIQSTENGQHDAEIKAEVRAVGAITRA